MNSTIFGFASKTLMTGEVFYLGGEVSRVIDRAIDFQAVALSDYEIVVAMTGRRVHRAGAPRSNACDISPNMFRLTCTVTRRRGTDMSDTNLLNDFLDLDPFAVGRPRSAYRPALDE